MVFATREEEIDYLRDELERAGYDESSNQKWDEATLGPARTSVPCGEVPADETGAKRRFGEEEAYIDALCPEGARGLLAPLLSAPSWESILSGPPPTKKSKLAPPKKKGVRDATNDPSGA